MLLHPKYDLLGEDLEASLLNSTAQPSEKKMVEPVVDPLDYDEALPPVYHVLATLAMCTKGHNTNAEQRCHIVFPLERVLFHLSRADISLNMRSVLLSFLHEVYVASSMAQVKSVQMPKLSPCRLSSLRMLQPSRPWWKAA